MTAYGLSSAQTAQRIGRSRDWWYRNWRTWCPKAGFPAPLPGDGQPRWYAAKVDRWLAGESFAHEWTTPQDRHPRPAPGNPPRAASAPPWAGDVSALLARRAQRLADNQSR